MNPQLKDKTLGFVDFGNYLEVAMRLAREKDGFGKVLYYCNWQCAYPKYDGHSVGDGIDSILPNFKHVTSIYDIMPEVDIWVFPDLYMGDIQEWLIEQGHLVFGAVRGENMELYRDKMKVHLKEVGLKVNDWTPHDGLDNLRAHLKDHPNLWVKTNKFRGSMESFLHEDYDMSTPRLDRFEHTLGLFKNRQVFTTEAPIDDSLDFAIDMITADGKYPLKALMGVEQKNASYVGVFTELSKAPKGILEIHDKLTKTLRTYHYRMALSLESRITKDGTAYLLDPCCRFPQPPTSLYIEMYDNFPDLVWQVANGDTPEISSKYKYGVQIVLKSEFAKKDFIRVKFPKEIENYVKIKNLCIEDGMWNYLPQEHDAEEIGGVIGMANTLKEAKQMCIKNAEQVTGDGLYWEKNALDAADEDIARLVKFGIKIF
jgi:hypothetical protein